MTNMKEMSKKELGEKLVLAAKDGNYEEVKACIEAGADVNFVSDILPYNSLIIASEKGHASVVQFLVDSGADLDAEVACDDALGVAYEYRNFDVIEILKEAKGFDTSNILERLR